ncbi:MAG: sensor histidine kinase [Marinifilaceae bacterium]
MRKRRTSKLLSKISLLFLLFIVVAFVISATILIFNANKYIDKSVERSFNKKEQQIIEKLEAGEAISFFKEARIIKLETVKKDFLQTDIDTVMQAEESNEMFLFRLRRKVITVNHTNYLLILKKNIDDFTNLKTDVISTLVPVFIILSIVIVIFNTFLSRYLFQPFNYILKQMECFRVGENFSFRKIKTSTREFTTLQELYLEMINQAEEDYRRIKEYTENMSHEFQTPLSIIRNKTENLIADEYVMNTNAKSVKAIYDEVNHLSKLSNTLKLLTKIENNEFVKREQIKSKMVIEDHVEKLRELAGLKSVPIELDLNEDHIFEIDPFLLEIVLKNLIRNAILYAKAKTTIQIKTSSDNFYISNTSELSETLPENIFERFAKGKSNPSSLGLGLAIVKKICELNALNIEHNFQESTHSFSISSVE